MRTEVLALLLYVASPLAALSPATSQSPQGPGESQKGGGGRRRRRLGSSSQRTPRTATSSCVSARVKSAPMPQIYRLTWKPPNLDFFLTFECGAWNVVALAFLATSCLSSSTSLYRTS